MSEPLGDRMKWQYEDRSRFMLPRRTWTIVRVDGKAFHTYTSGFKRPYDEALMGAMDRTAKFMCEEIQGARLAYVQSDEISILLTDFDKPATSAWFDGNLQKMASVAASLATGAFNADMSDRVGAAVDHVAFFDARVFTVPDPVEVANYFIWRQQDATRNSISMAAQALYSHEELLGRDSRRQVEMIFKKGVNWNSYPAGFKRGRAVVRNRYVVADIDVVTRWDVVEPPVFTQVKSWLRERIPTHPDFSWKEEAPSPCVVCANSYRRVKVTDFCECPGKGEHDGDAPVIGCVAPRCG